MCVKRLDFLHCFCVVITFIHTAFRGATTHLLALKKNNTFMFCTVVPDFLLYVFLGDVSQTANLTDIHISVLATSTQRPKGKSIQRRVGMNLNFDTTRMTLHIHEAVLAPELLR